MWRKISGILYVYLSTFMITSLISLLEIKSFRYNQNKHFMSTYFSRNELIRKNTAGPEKAQMITYNTEQRRFDFHE
jgi:hypothetical protein